MDKDLPFSFVSGFKKSGKPILLKNHCILLGILFITIISIIPLSAQDRYTRICQEAYEYEKSGKPEEAIRKYTEAIQMRESEWTGYSYRGNIYLQLGQLTDALSDFSQAISLSPGTLSLYSGRAECYFLLEDYPRSLDDFNKALTSVRYDDKNLYKSYFLRGKIYFKTGKYEAATKDFNLAIGLAEYFQIPGIEIYGFRGRSKLELSNYAEAISDFNVLLSANSENKQAVYSRGYCYFRIGDMEHARADALTYLEKDPGCKTLYSEDELLEIYNVEARRDKARVIFKDVHENLSGNAMQNQAFSSLNTAWILAPEFSQADMVFKDSLQKEIFIIYPLLSPKPGLPEYIEKLESQAKAASDAKKTDEAIRIWSDIVSLYPAYPGAWYSRAITLADKGNYAAAKSDMEKYLRLIPMGEEATLAKQKISEWQTKKIQTIPVPGNTRASAPVNEIKVYEYKGNYKFSATYATTFGLQTGKNPSLENLWNQFRPSTSKLNYNDRIPFLFWGEAEMVYRPIKRIGIGGFGKIGGGIGVTDKIDGTKYLMNMQTGQYGGLLRYYLIPIRKDRPDIFLQYALGKSQLFGFTGVATMTGIVFDYSYLNSYRSSAPYNSFGIGIGGKAGRRGYLALTLEYMNSEFKTINYKVTIDQYVTGNQGNTGVLINNVTGKNITALYQGIMLKFNFGLCL